MLLPYYKRKKVEPNPEIEKLSKQIDSLERRTSFLEVRDKVKHAVVAESKWEEWDNEFTSLEGPIPAQCYRHSREVFKQALRERIESWLPDEGVERSEFESGTDFSLKRVLRLLDTVEPPKP